MTFYKQEIKNHHEKNSDIWRNNAEAKPSRLEKIFTSLPVDFVTRLPENDLGECALMEMRKRGVGTQHIVRGGERLGIYFRGHTDS